MSLDDQPKDEISLSAQKCWGPFAEILAHLEHDRGSKHVVQEYQQRFEAWILFLGVFADSRLSLDHRLRNGPEVKSLILQQLQVLNRNLKAASNLATELQQEHTNDGSLRLFSALKATFYGIESALDRLHRLGVAIRQASAGQLMSRIKPLADDKRVSSFEILAYSVISTLYPGANSQLLAHVSASLALKYQVFLYRQGRERQYHGFVVHKSPPLGSMNREESLTDQVILPHPTLDRQEAKRKQVQSSVISSAFDAREFRNQVLETRTVLETPLPPTTSIRTGSVNYPPPQAINDDAKYAKCDWCLETHLASMFKTPAEWRRHVQKDWTPYVCISEQCANTTPIPSFAKSTEWERHMQAQHGDAWPRTIYKPLTWICDLDHPGTNETETLRFTTDTDLARHIRKSHKEIDSDEMQIMTRHNSVLLNRPADVCPFCCYTIEYNAKTKNAATDESEVQKTHPDVTVPDALKNLYDIPEESGDRSSKSCPPRRIDFHIAGHLNTFTMLMIRMISIPDNGDNIENGESAVFSESNSVGDDESDYQKWESSDDEDVSAKMPETSSNIQYYQPSVHENSHLSETSPERDNDVGSSVISVHDLGFSVAPPPTQIANDSLIQNITSVKMLRENLGLEPKIGTSVKESLREKIKLSLAHSQSNHGTKDGRFLPIDELNLILSGESIKALLEEEHSHKIEKDLNSKLKVYLSRRRILGTLLFMYPTHLRLFEGFVNEQITDEDLPLVSIGSTDEFSFRSRLGKENKTMFRAWEDHDIVLFYHYQPIFLAPFFDIQETRLCNYSLDEFIRLPWLKYELTTRGSNGMVYRVEIHPSHHNFKCYQPSNSPLYFALKEIPALDIETYQQELLALEKTRVQTQKERHLIKPLLTFQHGSKYYFLFEWADGNLWDYWTKYPDGSKHGIVNSLWMAEQCLGLATAVRRIHGLATWQKERRDRLEVLNEEEKGWGRHGDIKPHNILWFSSYRSDGCFLALSDLALTRYNSSVTRSRVSPTSLDGCTELYRPPELDIPGQHISSKYDIWSLGCVFLEFCTWWLRGLKSVQDFESQRATSDGSNEIFDEPKYFTISRTKGGAEPKVKGIVQEWIEGLRADAKDDLFLEPMLDLIRNKMLVVGRKNRYPADRVCTEIWNIVDGLRKAKTSRSIAENLTAEGYWGPQSSSSSSTDAEVPRSFFDDDLPDFETRTLN